MNLKHSLTFSLLALGLVTARAEEIKLNIPGKAEPAASTAPTAPKFDDAQLVEEFGWFIGKRVGLAELEFGKSEMDSLIKGLTSAASGKESPYDLEKIGPVMDEFMQKKQAVFVEKMKKQSTAASAAYFAKLKDNKNIVELPSGLRYEIVKPGAGVFPKPTETVRVNYTGTLVDGTVFDSSAQHNPPEPAEFALDQVIPGWTEGIQKINKGGKIKLYVPANLAYGDDGRQGIPPGSTLIFDVELLDIKPTPPAPAPEMPGAPGAPATK